MEILNVFSEGVFVWFNLRPGSRTDGSSGGKKSARFKPSQARLLPDLSQLDCIFATLDTCHTQAINWWWKMPRCCLAHLPHVLQMTPNDFVGVVFDWVSKVFLVCSGCFPFISGPTGWHHANYGTRGSNRNSLENCFNWFGGLFIG